MYASGKFALGICDICGFQYKLRELRAIIENRAGTGLKACSDCWVPDHPLNRLPEVAASHGQDREAIQDPRPANNDDRALAPGGHPNWLDLLTRGSV